MMHHAERDAYRTRHAPRDEDRGSMVTNLYLPPSGSPVTVLKPTTPLLPFIPKCGFAEILDGRSGDQRSQNLPRRAIR